MAVRLPSARTSSAKAVGSHCIQVHGVALLRRSRQILMHQSRQADGSNTACQDCGWSHDEVLSKVYGTEMCTTSLPGPGSRTRTGVLVRCSWQALGAAAVPAWLTAPFGIARRHKRVTNGSTRQCTKTRATSARNARPTAHHTTTAVTLRGPPAHTQEKVGPMQ